MNDPVLKEPAESGENFRIKINAPVFLSSAVLILAFALFGALFPERSKQIFDALQAGIVAARSAKPKSLRYGIRLNNVRNPSR